MSITSVIWTSDYFEPGASVKWVINFDSLRLAEPALYFAVDISMTERGTGNYSCDDSFYMDYLYWELNTELPPNSLVAEHMDAMIAILNDRATWEWAAAEAEEVFPPVIFAWQWESSLSVAITISCEPTRQPYLSSDTDYNNKQMVMTVAEFDLTPGAAPVSLLEGEDPGPTLQERRQVIHAARRAGAEENTDPE